MEFLLKPFTVIVFFFLVCSIIFPSFRCQEDDEEFRKCSRPYKCGNISSFPFPFWGGDDQHGYCGHPDFKVSCNKENHTVFQINNLEYRILNLILSNQTNTIRVARTDLSEDPCSPRVPYVNSTLSYAYGLSMNFSPKVENLTLFYDCGAPRSNREYRSFPYNFSCTGTISSNVFYAKDSWLESLEPNSVLETCGGVIRVPIFEDALDERPSSGEEGKNEVREALSKGFEVLYPEFTVCKACEDSGGKCGYSNSTPQSFRCLCPHGERHSPYCTTHRGPNQILKTIIGSASAGITILLICITICCSRIWASAIRPTRFWKNITKEDKDLEAFIRNYGHLTVKRYRFSEIKKMTESFKDKLGKGGYGEVYKGKLLDEALVAVKILNAAKGNGQEFINEVASISRTSHVNIVSLLGFCLEDGKRALIYEFMPNGSLEKFIYNDYQLQSIPHLAWEKLHQIAIGIARGLEYLHRGCSTRILHFDIKPHNILLDKDFCPRISDFGLAKLCPDKESIVSSMAARGTIGYIAPEVFNRNFGRASSKSDVYSYGMLILEIVGGRKNIKVEVSQTSEIYFPDWIYEHFQQGSNLGLWGEMTSEENEIARKMVIVGLWCIQTMPSERPSMSKVIEMLEGSLGALHLPQKPSLFAPRPPERFPTELTAESSSTSIL